ncbi:MAG: hypothetical protein IPJ40_06795 [Saprospirales bacterium]|nr:hypothetical protein [Saprospirales bacterium]
MKFWFLLIIFGLGSIPRIFAQWDGEDSLCAVPVGVKKAFQDQYPKAEEVYWVKGKNDYRASFFVEGLSHEIRYSSSGQWICASTYLDLADLPKSIQDFLTHRFPEWEIPSVLQKLSGPIIPSSTWSTSICPKECWNLLLIIREPLPVKKWTLTTTTKTNFREECLPS